MMNVKQACGVIALNRQANSLLIATMGAMKAFDILEGETEYAQLQPKGSRISSVPLMGGAAGLGLGLAMGCPDRKVVVVDGDASLLLELGSLVTVAQACPKNYLHVVIHNGTQFTGLANLHAPAKDFDFKEAARNAGYRHVFSFKDQGLWAQQFCAIDELEGPVFVALSVQSLPAVADEGFDQVEMPDYQFERMGLEANAMDMLLNSGRS